MSRSSKQGIVVGIFGPLLFLGGIVLWIYHRTRKVPFPVRRVEEGELVVRLVEPNQVPSYWQHWKEELAPVLDQLYVLVAELVSTYEGERKKR